MVEKIFGADIDIPAFKDKVGVKAQLKHLATYLSAAKKVELLVLGELETKYAFRIRIQGIYEAEEDDGLSPMSFKFDERVPLIKERNG